MSDTPLMNEEVIEQPAEPVEQKPKRRRTTKKAAPVVEEQPATPAQEAEAPSQEAEPEQTPKRRGRPKKVVDPNAPPKPKRKCSEKQLAALAAGRAKNSRFHPRTSGVSQSVGLPKAKPVSE